MKGYVYQDSNNNWRARFTYTDQNKERRYVKRRAKVNTEEGARAELAQIIKEYESRPSVVVYDVTGLCDYYEKEYCLPAVFVEGRKIDGLKDYKRVKMFLGIYRSHFGRIKLKDLTYEHIKRFRLKRLQTPTKRGSRTITTVNRELTWLRRILNIAVQKDWIPKNPFHRGDSLISIAAEKKRQRILTRDEEQKLIAACSGRLRNLRLVVLFFLDTGLRHREMLTLGWDCVDLESGVLKIKTEHSKTETERLVGITKRLRDEFALIEPKEGKVFKYKCYINKTFDSARRKAGLIDLRIHDLRHTFATRAAEKIELVQLANVLGHTQIQTTFRYTNNSLEIAKRVAASVDLD